jgi:predicted metal-dependent phosphotriesterase family hydrolase
VVKAAKDVGVSRIVITHPEFPTTLLSIDQQKELAKLGAFFERCFTTPNTGKISWEQVYANIRQVGPSSTILATDLGQTTAPYPDEGLGIFITRLLENGFTESEVRGMVRDNPAQVLGAKRAATAAA